MATGLTVSGNQNPNKAPKGGGSSSGYKYPFVASAKMTEIDQGVDLSMSPGDPIAAIGNCHSFGVVGNNFNGQPYMVYQLKDGPKAGKYIYISEQITNVKSGDVQAGQPICNYASSGTAIEIGWAGDASPYNTLARANGENLATRHQGSISDPAHAGTAAGRDFYNFLQQLKKGGPISGSGGGGGGTSGNNNAFAVASTLDLYSADDVALAMLLPHNKSLMNDKPLLPFIEQLCNSSLRQFMSMPNGDFYAFFPDYFGSFGKKKGYWQIHDLEILDGKIELSDEALATHVFVVGDTIGSDMGAGGGQSQLVNMLESTGVVSVLNAGVADFINDPNKSPSTPDSPGAKKTDKTKTKKKTNQGSNTDEVPFVGNERDALEFLNRYGARPYYEDAPYIRSHILETFVAYQTFMLMWARQFITTFTFTFMPELYPGGLVEFPEHGFQCYIDEVVHSFDYENGFTTQANLSAPSAIDKTKGGNSIARGMITSGVFGDPAAFDSQGNSLKSGDNSQTQSSTTGSPLGVPGAKGN